MKLYTSPGACSTADHIVLEWIGAPYEFEVVSREQRKQPAFLAMNPAGAVPVLEVGDWTLTQNAAILHYLCDRFPETKLDGDGTPQGRAEVNRWLSLVNADVHPSYWPLFGSTAALGEEANARAHGMAKQKLRGYYERIDAQLSGKNWVTGNRSVVDPYLFITLQWAKNTGVDLSGLDNLARFDAHMAADPGVQEAMKAEGLA